MIGLEIHVQLATRTKMFCGCELSFGDEPNTHTCPICLAQPGVLPVPNEQAILYALQIAAALECEIAPRSIFHRKNYFYPDNPRPTRSASTTFRLPAGKLGEIRIHRAHLEEDAAKTIHVGESGRIHGSDASWSTSTAAARRWSRSSPSPTCATPPKPPSGRGCCARRSASSASPT